MAAVRARRVNWGNVAAYTILGVWMVFTLFPVAWLLLSSVKEPAGRLRDAAEVGLHADAAQLRGGPRPDVPTELETVTEQQAGTGESPFPRFLLNTTIVAVGTTVLSLTLGSAAAYALTRFYPAPAARS